MPWPNVLRRFVDGRAPGAPAIDTAPATEPQQSPLLSRLPLEIRLQIWEEVVGNRLLHLVLDPSCPHNGTLKCFPCGAFYKNPAPLENKLPNGGDASPRCQGSQQAPCFFSGPATAPFSALSMLLSCRQIYNEAIELVYVTNTLNIDNLEILQLAIKAMGPRISSISTVHVNTAMWKINCYEVTRFSPMAYREWAKFWQLLAERMSGLEHLRLDIYGTSRTGFSKRDLEPLLQLRGLQSFDLALWQDTKEQHLHGQGSTVVGPMQTIIRSHICGRST